MPKIHIIKNAMITGTILQIQVDGKEHRIELKKHSPLVAAAAPEQISNFIISPSGYGINWPDLDEDLSIDGLLGITHAPPKMKAVA